MTHPAAFKPLSKHDVADILGVTVRTIENHILAGILPPPVAIGNRRYWHPGVFYAWLEKALHADAKNPSAPELVEACGAKVAEAPAANDQATDRRPKGSKNNGSASDRARARDQALLGKLNEPELPSY